MRTGLLSSLLAFGVVGCAGPAEKGEVPTATLIFAQSDHS